MVNKMPITSWEEIQKRRRKNQQEEPGWKKMVENGFRKLNLTVEE